MKYPLDLVNNMRLDQGSGTGWNLSFRELKGPQRPHSDWPWVPGRQGLGQILFPSVSITVCVFDEYLLCKWMEYVTIKFWKSSEGKEEEYVTSLERVLGNSPKIAEGSGP